MLIQFSTSYNQRPLINSAPGLNFTIFFSLIVISEPVLGFLPFLAGRVIVENDPNPTNEILSPLQGVL